MNSQDHVWHALKLDATLDWLSIALVSGTIWIADESRKRINARSQ